jgi:hypothetical protein
MMTLRTIRCLYGPYGSIGKRVDELDIAWIDNERVVDKANEA